MGRNTFAEDGWILENIDDLSVCETFDCNDDDLNDYFHNDVKWHKEELLTQTYRLYKDTDSNLTVGLLDFCNDTLRINKPHLPLDINPLIPYNSLPAVKLTRFGITSQFQRKNIGTHVLNMVKRFFTTENRTGCRFITVDAYSNVTDFYRKNGFGFYTDKDREKPSRLLKNSV